MKIALDVDGVLANFSRGFIGQANKIGIGELFPKNDKVVKDWGFGVSKEIFTSVWETLTEDFWLNLPVVEQSRPPIPFTPFIYLTSRPFESAITYRWLHANRFPTSEVVTVSHPSEKVPVLLERGIDILIDDYIPTILEVCAAGKRGILFKAPYQQSQDTSQFEKCNSLWDLPDEWRESWIPIN